MAKITTPSYKNSNVKQEVREIIKSVIFSHIPSEEKVNILSLPGSSLCFEEDIMSRYAPGGTICGFEYKPHEWYNLNRYMNGSKWTHRNVYNNNFSYFEKKTEGSNIPTQIYLYKDNIMRMMKNYHNPNILYIDSCSSLTINTIKFFQKICIYQNSSKHKKSVISITYSRCHGDRRSDLKKEFGTDFHNPEDMYYLLSKNISNISYAEQIDYKNDNKSEPMVNLLFTITKN